MLVASSTLHVPVLDLEEQQASATMRFRILHRFHKPGSDCLPGEEIGLIWLVVGSREYSLNFPLALRILFDYLARHRWLPQSSVQIEAGIRRDAFCLRHGANARTSHKQTRRISRSTVKEYVKRIRQALSIAFGEAGLNIDPAQVLTSEPRIGNEVAYRLKATVEWMHLQ